MLDFQVSLFWVVIVGGIITLMAIVSMMNAADAKACRDAGGVMAKAIGGGSICVSQGSVLYPHQSSPNRP